MTKPEPSIDMDDVQLADSILTWVLYLCKVKITEELGQGNAPTPSNLATAGIIYNWQLLSPDSASKSELRVAVKNFLVAVVVGRVGDEPSFDDFPEEPGRVVIQTSWLFQVFAISVKMWLDIANQMMIDRGDTGELPVPDLVESQEVVQCMLDSRTIQDSAENTLRKNEYHFVPLPNFMPGRPVQHRGELN